MSMQPTPTLGGSTTGARWQLRLLGAVQLQQGRTLIERFPSRAVVLLLARLALAPDRAHPREELVELLWPGAELAVGRNRLRQVLSTLKALLEPPGATPAQPVLLADRLSLRLAPGALDCDALRFEQALRARRPHEAAALWRGELLPGHYDEWVLQERQRLNALHDRLPAEPASAAIEPAMPLPHYLTRLFGAELPLARVHGLVRTQRLVTLLGPGGSGKTRLAVEVAHAFAEPVAWAMPSAEPGPVFDRLAFVPLVSCDTTAQLLAALAQALQLPAAAAAADTARAVVVLAEALAGRSTLLVLDNAEQLVAAEGGAPARALGALLAALPQLHLLVTSRRALALDGECCIEAEPLLLPGQADAAAAASPAVALFVDRARAAQADFHLGPHNQAAVVALVRQLGGLPLAIELAASRVRSCAPAEMLRLLQAGSGAHLVLLARSGPRAGHDPRHASMEQVVAWSWRLLDDAERGLLAALCVFAGDASAEALAHVLGEPVPTVAARLDGLAAHSLIRAVDGGSPARFGLMEPVREYALAQIEPAQAAALHAALRAWLLHWARGLGAAPAPARVAPELRTLHAVLAAAPEAPHEALQIALALRGYWDSDGLPGALQGALEQALAQLPASTDEAPLRSDLHEMLAYLRFEGGFAAEARAHADAALAAAGGGAAPGLSRRARALVRRAWVELAAGRSDDDGSPTYDRLQRWLEEALALAEACADREAQARALHQLAVIASHVRNAWPLAEAQLAASQALWQALGDRRKAAARLRNRAQCWLHMGRGAEALLTFERCEREAREQGDWVGQIDSLLSLSAQLARDRRWAEALEACQRCVALSWQRWHRHGLGYALWNPPRLLARLRQPEAAMRLMAFAVRFWRQSFGTLSRADERYVRRVRALVTAQLGAARAEALWLEGEALDIRQAVALAHTGAVPLNPRGANA